MADETFDDWAREGRDREIAGRHWHTAKHALAAMPVEDGDTVLDLGSGSGYATRALADRGAGRAYGLDGAPEMARNAREYTDDPDVGYVIADFGAVPFGDDTLDHAFSMEALFFAEDPHETLAELRRALRPGGTFYCAVDYYAESVHTRDWPDRVGVEMTRWSREEYRRAFRDAGFVVAAQTEIPDCEIEIPPAEEFPTEQFDTREAMVERYREHGTLLTVGVVPPSDG